jgi:hypothetical protein
LLASLPEPSGPNGPREIERTRRALEPSRGSPLEPIAELQTEKFGPAKPENAKVFLTDSENAQAKRKDVSNRVGLITAEDDENVFFETRDRAQNDAWVHRNYIKKN